MCLSPITIFNRNPKSPYAPNATSIQVPCGKCLECKRAYQNAWLVRLTEEFRNYHNCLFVTLTYNEDNVPLFTDTRTGESFRTVVVKHVQDWIKRFRRNYQREYGTTADFKYFITSEYGPRTLRPHYHCLIWGLTQYEFHSAIMDWQNRFGYVKCKKVKYEGKSIYQVSRYVSKYCCKGLFENPLVSQKRVNKTFHLISKKLGYTYVERKRDYHLCKHLFAGSVTDPAKNNNKIRHYKKEYLEVVADNMRVYIDGCPLPFLMPRYYKNKIYGTKPYLQVQISNILFDRACELRERKLREIQACIPDREKHKAYYYLALQEAREVAERATELRKTLGAFYDKSRL